MTQFEDKDYNYAWKVLNPDEKDSIKIQDIKETLQKFLPDISTKEILWMFGKGPITLQKIRDIIEKPIVTLNDFGLTKKATEFDPFEEAINKFLDLDSKGHIAQRELMKKLVQLKGIEKFDEFDKQILMQLSDVDEDGIISYHDFRTMTKMSQVSVISKLRNSSTKKQKQ